MNIRTFWQRMPSATMVRITYVYRDLRWRLEDHKCSSHWEEKARNYRWIFVLGCNNSGTTLIYRALGLHPEISALPREGHRLTKVVPHPDALHCSRIWTERLDAFRLTEYDNRCERARLVYDWINYKKKDSTEFILEKSPPDALRTRWLQDVFRHSYFIGLVRNGYAVCEGISRRTGYSLERCARHWNLANKIMLEDARFLDHFKLLSYEEFTRDPTTALDSLANFLGIDETPFRSIADKEFAVHNIEATQSQIRDFNSSSLSKLSGEDKAIINLHAREMLERFGYFIT